MQRGRAFIFSQGVDQWIKRDVYSSLFNNIYFAVSFYKNSTNKILTFVSSKVVYSKKHLAYQVWQPWKTKFPLPIDVLYCPQTIKPAVKAIAESLRTSVRVTSAANLSLLQYSSSWCVINGSFYSTKKIMFCSRDMQIFVFLWNPQISKSMTSP